MAHDVSNGLPTQFDFRPNAPRGGHTGFTPEEQERLDAFLAEQAAELEAFEQEQAQLTPQQQSNIDARDAAAQADFNAQISGSELAEQTAGQGLALRDEALAQINQRGETPRAGRLPGIRPAGGVPSLGGISESAARESSAAGLNFAELRSTIEGDRLSRRGLFEDQRQFIDDILAEQQNMTEGQKALISQAANQAIALGTGDIKTNLRDVLGLLREELAPSRGLRSTDSPIIDRGGKLATESLRLGERLTSQVRGSETAALLELPRAQREFQLRANEQLAQLISQESGMDIESARQLASLQANEESLRQGQLNLTGNQAFNAANLSEEQRQFTSGQEFNLASLLESQRQFTSGLDLDRDRLRTEQINTQQGFGQALQQFQNFLKAQSFNQNLATTTQAANFGLGLSSIAPGGSAFQTGQTGSGTGQGQGGNVIAGIAAALAL